MIEHDRREHEREQRHCPQEASSRQALVQEQRDAQPLQGQLQRHRARHEHAGRLSARSRARIPNRRRVIRDSGEPASRRELVQLHLAGTQIEGIEHRIQEHGRAEEGWA